MRRKAFVTSDRDFPTVDGIPELKLRDLGSALSSTFLDLCSVLWHLITMEPPYWRLSHFTSSSHHCPDFMWGLNSA
jgi:hypothetical protein